MKITDGLKSLEKALEKELKEFFVILGESEAPEVWPHHQEPAQDRERQLSAADSKVHH